MGFYSRPSTQRKQPPRNSVNPTKLWVNCLKERVRAHIVSSCNAFHGIEFSHSELSHFVYYNKLPKIELCHNMDFRLISHHLHWSISGADFCVSLVWVNCFLYPRHTLIVQELSVQLYAWEQDTQHFHDSFREHNILIILVNINPYS